MLQSTLLISPLGSNTIILLSREDNLHMTSNIVDFLVETLFSVSCLCLLSFVFVNVLSFLALKGLHDLSSSCYFPITFCNISLYCCAGVLKPFFYKEKERLDKSTH